MSHCNTSHIISILMLSFYVCSAATSPSTNQSGFESKKLKLIRNYLKKINKPAVKTIQSPDGDLIDCVLFHQQPAFDNPMLEKYKSIRVPPEMPTGSSPNTTYKKIVQVWRLSGESCPNNTVPIRRTTEEDVLRAGSVGNFNAKSRFPFERATGYVKGKFRSAEAYINVWRPTIQYKYEFSSSQIWVSSGSGGSLSTIEVGNRVNFGDQQSRFFIYWTKDGYRKTGCYDVLCAGFIRYFDNDIAFGAAWVPSSVYGDINNQYSVKVSVFKSTDDGIWWLRVNGECIGHWPPELFAADGLQNHADTVELGGEVVNIYHNSGKHTSTQMGSGSFSGQGFSRSAFVGSIVLSDDNNHKVQTPKFEKTTTSASCYDVRLADASTVYYGGPGKSPNARWCT